MSQVNIMKALVLPKHESLEELITRQTKVLENLTSQCEALRDFVASTKAMQRLGK